MTGRVLMAMLLAGWLADRLARPDRDVEAGIEAYEAGELDAALERFDAAIARHGDRPELSLNRGLVLLAQGLRTPQASDPEAAAKASESDAARRAFERASESDDPEVRASAFYERGNVAFDAELWDAAIEAYIECLKARPDHANAKWNLELARLRKQEQEKEDEEEKDEEEEEQDETGGEDSGSSGEDSGSTGDESGGSTGDDSGGSSDGGSGDEGGSSGDQGSSGGGDSGGSGGSGESGGSGGQPPEGESGEEPKDDQPPAEQPPAPQPAPLDQMDLQKALDELDEQDRFLLDRPSGGVRPPTEDW
jgi:Ca-activated chloride channel family protein